MPNLRLPFCGSSEYLHSRLTALNSHRLAVVTIAETAIFGTCA